MSEPENELRVYLVEFFDYEGCTIAEYWDFLVADEYEAIEQVKKFRPDAVIQNVFLQLYGDW